MDILQVHNEASTVSKFEPDAGDRQKKGISLDDDRVETAAKRCSQCRRAEESDEIEDSPRQPAFWQSRVWHSQDPDAVTFLASKCPIGLTRGVRIGTADNDRNVETVGEVFGKFGK